ncbi:TPA: hypothetical protein OMT64_004499 [Enterobacter roggenkampii]|uniref:hypothetical protein n=1 Tax=Enterobacter roggenkampii TaxID=1812935 RepID=UPI003BD564FA|nr:hypothetical protein [Enterobacter roggenkampii]
MVDWFYESILRVLQHYKEMTAIALLLTLAKILFPILMRWLTKRMERSEYRKRVKLWTDIGFREEEADKIVRDFDKSIEGKLKRTSILSRIKKHIRTKTL